MGMLKKYFPHALILSIILIIIIIVIILITSRKKCEGPKTCKTPDCLKTASILLDNINTSANPCQNFFEFACGGWIAKHPVRKSAIGRRAFDLLNEKEAFYLLILLKLPLPKSAPKAWRIMKDVHNTCLKLGKNKIHSRTFLTLALKQIGDWPVTIGLRWNETEFDFIDALSRIVNMGLGDNFLINFRILPCLKNNSLNRITLLQPSFINEQEKYYFGPGKKHNAFAYIQGIKTIARNFGWNLTHREHDELREIFEFEASLVGTTDKKTWNYSNIGYFTLKTLENIAPQIQWKKYFNSFTDLDIGDNELLQIYYPKQLVRFSNLMARTRKRTIANYLSWRAVKSFDKMLDTNSHCLSVVINNLHIALASLYVNHRFFNNEAEKMISDIILHIRRNIISSVKQNNLMTPKVRNFAAEKIDKILVKFPVVHELLNFTLVDQYYTDLTVGTKSHAFNVVNMKIWKLYRSFSLLRKINHLNKWENNVAIEMSTSTYYPFSNLIEITPTFAMGPMFNENRPNYLNFGAIGSVIAHEFMHAIIPPGNMADGDGNANNWWDDNTTNMYTVPASCIIKQYDKFRYPGAKKNVYGAETLIENFVDNAGIIAAYNAYLSWEKDNFAESLLPGLKYTAKQLFWISYANVWCSNYNIRIAEDILLNDKHSPGMFRVLGPLANNEAFSRDFKCPLGSPMNPMQKCRVFG